MNSTYEFDIKNHIHTLGGKPLMGVTTVLKVIAKPALIQWAANMACDYIDQARHSEKFKVEDLGDILKEARIAHKKKKETAGGWGTEVHAEVERYVKNSMITDGKAKDVTNYDERIVKFIDWSKENEVKFLESEKHVWSKELWIGGIADMVFEINGKKYIGDVKTSSGIYPEHFMQMAAYQMCLEEMGITGITGYMVINLKKDGKMEIKEVDDLLMYREAFKCALGLHKILTSLK